MDFEDFTDIQDTRSDVFENRLEEALRLKDLGNSHFSSGDLFNAEYFYHLALYHVNFDELQWNFELLDPHREAANLIRNPVCLNLAAVRIQLGNYEKAVELCKFVLKEDEGSSKAYYRKALACFYLDNDTEALDSITFASRLSPQDVKILNLRRQIRRKIHREQEKINRFWQGKFKPKPLRVSLRNLLSFLNPLNFHFTFFPIL